MTARIRRRITEAWREVLPGFQIWKPGRLLRRLGPVLQGVTLDWTNDRYYPTAHVHALVTDFPVVSLTLAHRLSYGSLPAADDSRQIAEIAHELAVESPLSLDVPPSLEQIVRAYDSSVLDRDAAAITDSVLVSAFVSQDFLDAQLEYVARVSAEWPRFPAVFDTIREWKAGRESWLSGLAAQADDIEGLKLRVERNAELLGVDQISDIH